MIKGAHGKFYFIAKKKGRELVGKNAARVTRVTFGLSALVKVLVSSYIYILFGVSWRLPPFAGELCRWVLINYPTVLITSFPSISTSSFFKPPTVFSPAMFSQPTLSNLSL